MDEIWRKGPFEVGYLPLDFHQLINIGVTVKILKGKTMNGNSLVLSLRGLIRTGLRCHHHDLIAPFL